jgi:hypothetical protein
MANPRPDEKDLAWFALEKVRKNGGVLEHPKGSRLWKEASLPLPGEFPDEHGGFTLLIDQYHFGHVARKWTHLYIVGIEPKDLPEIPIRGGNRGKLFVELQANLVADALNTKENTVLMD